MGSLLFVDITNGIHRLIKFKPYKLQSNLYGFLIVVI